MIFAIEAISCLKVISMTRQLKTGNESVLSEAEVEVLNSRILVRSVLEDFEGINAGDHWQSLAGCFPTSFSFAFYFTHYV
jgi:hypothetical protein